LAIKQFRLLTSIKSGVRLYAIVLQGSTVFCDEPKKNRRMHACNGPESGARTERHARFAESPRGYH
ncbi:hypothetical protein, partial [Burkholderia pseudomallei]|uniref:hypothetical protein n=1 Tax=Burkholderia pseudomallei TaxID=28450 RepID=UPI001F37B70A